MASNGLSSTTEIRWQTSTLSSAAANIMASSIREASLLLCTLPHHMDIIDQSSVSITSLSYDSVIGSNVGVVGSVWTLVDTFGTNGNIAWQAPTAIPANRIADIRKQLLVDKDIVDWKSKGDPYFGGKGLAKMARLALIADELGESSVALEIRTNMKQVIQPWLSGTNSDKWQYDTTWGGVVPSSGVKDPGADFGAGYYNDHHFHHGYFIYAAAAIIKGDSAWGVQYKDAIISLVRDIANPSGQDRYFPVHRYFDLYASHSWASGLFEFADARNQESSSEAINAWYGMYLLGSVLNDVNLRDLGSYLLHSEIRATKKYWHSTTASSVYPDVFGANKCVGMVWGDKVVYTTWFASGAIYVHGINMLPFTPITELYLTRDWVTEEYPVVWASVKDSLATTEQGWLGFLYMDHAVIDPDTAWNEIMTLKSFDDGNTLTNALYWIATRPRSS
jgi:endo-1,3(4)-beta-glucanase